MADAFTYKAISYDQVKKEYTLQNVSNGRLKVVSKEDYDFYIEEASKQKQKKPHSGKNNCRRVT